MSYQIMIPLVAPKHENEHRLKYNTKIQRLFPTIKTTTLTSQQAASHYGRPLRRWYLAPFATDATGTGASCESALSKPPAAAVMTMTSTYIYKWPCVDGTTLSNSWLLHNLVEASFDLFRYLLLSDQLSVCWNNRNYKSHAWTLSNLEWKPLTLYSVLSRCGMTSWKRRRAYTFMSLSFLWTLNRLNQLDTFLEVGPHEFIGILEWLRIHFALALQSNHSSLINYVSLSHLAL